MRLKVSQMTWLPSLGQAELPSLIASAELSPLISQNAVCIGDHDQAVRLP